MKIIGAPWPGLLAGLLVAACGGGPASTAGGGGAASPGPARIPADRALVLEAWGAAPADTAVAFPPGLTRSLVIRHGPPDNTVFAELRFPAEAFAGAGVDSVRVAVHVLPGLYGLRLSANAPLGPGATLTFKYPIHFTAPARARDRYGSAFAYERALHVLRREPNGSYRVLESRRPATDNLAATIPDTGTYVAGAGR